MPDTSAAPTQPAPRLIRELHSAARSARCAGLQQTPAAIERCAQSAAALYRVMQQLQREILAHAAASHVTAGTMLDMEVALRDAERLEPALRAAEVL